jgi:hypothetical protein
MMYQWPHSNTVLGGIHYSLPIFYYYSGGKMNDIGPWIAPNSAASSTKLVR